MRKTGDMRGICFGGGFQRWFLHEEGICMSRVSGMFTKVKCKDSSKTVNKEVVKGNACYNHAGSQVL